MSDLPAEPYRRRLLASDWCEFWMYSLPPSHPLWRQENTTSDGPLIAMPWTSVVIDRSSSRRELVNPNSAVFYHSRQPYRRHLASPRGECCAFFKPSPGLMRSAFEEAGVHASIDGFPFATGPAVSWATREHHTLARGITRTGCDTLEAEASLTEIVRRLVLAASARAASAATPPPDGTRRAHRDLAEHTRFVLCQSLDEPTGWRSMGIAEIARRVHASPYHLCRVFKREVGVSIGTYSMRLRLRSAAEQIAWSDDSITQIAHRYGFSSHAHFTSAWSAEFGSPPTAMRRARS